MSIQSLSQSLSQAFHVDRIGNIAEFAKSVRSIQDEFKKLSRSEIGSERLVQLKYQMQHWRLRVCDLLLDAAERGCSKEDALELIHALSALGLKPSREKLARLLAWGKGSSFPEIRQALAEYFAQVNEHELVDQILPSVPERLSRMAGPKKKLPITANAPSRCGFEKWSKMEEFSNYLFDGEGVHYRGLHLLPGDFLISNVNRDGNGVYTALCEPRSYGYHLGTFAIVDHEGRRFPVVMETYKLGVRAVPLSTFLSESFNSYVEVCRPAERPPGFHANVNRHAAELPRSVKGYNFDTEDPDRSYLACTTVGTHLAELSGAKKIRSKSRYLQEERIQKNLSVFEFVLPAFLSLSDYLVDENVEFVGAVDNGHFHKNVAREIFERHFVDLFRSFNLLESRLPFMYGLNEFGVRQMRAGSALGKLIGLPYGLNEVNLPKGPEKVLAIIEIWEHMIEAAVKSASSQIEKLWDTSKLVDVEALSRDRKIKAVTAEKLKPIRRSFV